MGLKLKQRLIGTALLGLVAVAILPWLLDGSGYRERHPAVELPPEPQLPEPTIFAPRNKVLNDTRRPAEPAREVTPATSPAPEAAGGATETLSLEETPQLDAEGVPVAWTLQLASFKEAPNAVALRERLLASGYQAYLRSKGELHRVFVGPELQRSSLERLQQRIRREYQLDGLILRFVP